jgi:hypothetical protein
MAQQVSALFVEVPGMSREGAEYRPEDASVIPEDRKKQL